MSDDRGSSLFGPRRPSGGEGEPPPPPPPPPPLPPAATPTSTPASPSDLPRAWPEAWDAPLPPPPADPNARYAPPGTVHGGTGATGQPPADPYATPDPYAPNPYYQEGDYPQDALRPVVPFQPAYNADPSQDTDVYAPGYEPPYRGAAPYPPGAYPPPPPPPGYQPPHEPAMPSRGVTFKRREENQGRGLAIPIAAILILLAGGGIIFWLLGGTDRRPPQTASPTPTIAGVVGSPSGSPSGSASASPSVEPSSQEPSPSEEPSPTDEESPSESPTTEPTEGPSEPTEPPPSTEPPTEPPVLPTPVPTEAPPGIVVGQGETLLKVDLADNDFTGGRSGTYHDRSARWVYGQGTDEHTMTARFEVTGAPLHQARFRMNGLDSEDSRHTQMRIRINGVEIFRGPDPLANDVCCGSGGDGHWTSEAFDFDAGLLKTGVNRVSISNLAPSGRIGVPFVMLDEAKLLYIVGE